MSGRIQGYISVVDPGPRSGAPGLTEYDTKLCGHCQRIILTKPGSASTVYLIPQPGGQPMREEPGAGCRVCMSPVCLVCWANGGCTPWERRMEQLEARARFKASVP